MEEGLLCGKRNKKREYKNLVHLHPPKVSGSDTSPPPCSLYTLSRIDFKLKLSGDKVFWKDKLNEFTVTSKRFACEQALGFKRVQSAGWRVGCQQHTGFLRILNTIQCQRNIRLYFRFAWKLLRLGLILGTVCGPWSATKSHYLEYLSSIKT